MPNARKFPSADSTTDDVDCIEAPVPEPFSITTAAKAVGDGLAAIWARSAILLWAAATASAATLIVLVGLAQFQMHGAAEFLTAYGLPLALGATVLTVFAAFKTIDERPRPTVSLIPDMETSFWGQSPQSDGRVITQFTLRFQATNLTDRAVMLSAVRLRRPCVGIRHVVVNMLVTRDQHAGTYSSQYPIMPRDLTTASAHLTVDKAVGRTTKSRRVVIDVQDHAGRWHKLVFPLLRALPTPSRLETST